MLKKILLFAMFLTFSAGLFWACKGNKKRAVEKNPNHEIRPESPKIKSIRSYGSESRNGADTIFQLEEYDKNGFKIRTVKYLAAEIPEYEINFTNNKDGKKVSAVTKYPGGSTETEELVYNNDENVTATNWKRSDGSSGKHEYKYDEEGEIVQWDWYEDDKFVISRLYPSVYNENGKPMQSFYRETKNNRDTATINQYEFSYDENSRLIRKLSVEDEVPVAVEEYIYDSIGNKIVEIYYVPDSMQSGTLTLSHKQFNTYNKYGELVNYTIAEGHAGVTVNVTNTYNQYGHLIEAIYEYANGAYRKEKFVYEYWEQ